MARSLQLGSQNVGRHCGFSACWALANDQSTRADGYSLVKKRTTLDHAWTAVDPTTHREASKAWGRRRSPASPNGTVLSVNPLQAWDRWISSWVGDHQRIPTVVCFYYFLLLHCYILGWGRHRSKLDPYDCFTIYSVVFIYRSVAGCLDGPLSPGEAQCLGYVVKVQGW